MPGTLAFFLAATPAARACEGAPAALARELSADGDRAACAVECRRVLLADPANAEAARLLAGTCAGQSARRPAPGGRRWIAAPFAAVIRFYGSQVSPAIGRRCSLWPSCSAYAVEAVRKHGLLGIAMYADRAVSEPGIVAAARRPVEVDGRRRYADPVEDHDWWMTPSRRERNR
jgi:hypothetical protein